MAEIDDLLDILARPERVSTIIGDELTATFLVDQINALPFEFARDRKRAGNGDTGPNTGGMGADSPVAGVTDTMRERILQEIALPVIRYMASIGIPYDGVLYLGLMVTPGGTIYLLEINVRFGDPEILAILARLKSPLGTYLLATTTKGGLASLPPLEWDKRHATCVVMTSGGYPGKYDTGFPIRGLDDVKSLPNVRIYHAGTERDASGRIGTAGGRVLNVVGLGRDKKDSTAHAYDGVSRIFWAKEYHRADI